MKKHTQAEEEIIQLLWSLKEGDYLKKKSKLIYLFKIDKTKVKAYCHNYLLNFNKL
jgi:hypothetical protein